MIPASPANRTEPSQLWVPVGAFLLTGLLAAILLAAANSAESRTLAITLWSAFGQVAVVGAVSSWVARFTLASFARWEGDPLAAFALAFASLGVWFVPVAFLAAQDRLWTLPAALLLGWATGALARRCAPAIDAPDEAGDDHNPMPAFLYSPGRSNRSIALPVLAAALVELGSFMVFGGQAPRGALLAGAGGLVLGLKVAPTTNAAPLSASRTRRWMHLTTSILAAFLLTSVLTIRPPGGGSSSVPGHPATSRPRPASDDMVAGAILLGKPVGVVRLIAPVPPNARSGAIRPLRPPEPMAIEFSGVYWVLHPRQRRPTAQSLIVRETPLDYRFTMVDRSMLFMQARQELPQTIDPACCSHLELAIRGNDPQPQTIMLEVELAATATGRQNRVSLGKQRLSGTGPLTLRYPIPPNAAQLDANLILVTYHLYMPRVHRSANVAIERFVFIPRTW